jgi:hypothetical protein
MRKISFVVGIVCLLALMAAAQEVPRGEVFFGYSYVRVATGSQVNAFNNNGGLGEAQVNLNEYLSLVAELGGFVAGNVSIKGPELSSLDQTYFTYQCGPRITWHKLGRIAPFGHFLIGGAHESRSFAVPNVLIPPGAVVPPGVTAEVNPQTTRFRTSQNAYAMTIGGGFDVNISRRFAVRPFQLDYLPSHFSPFNIPGLSTIGVNNNTNWQNNLRYSAGIAFRFGQDVGPNTR